MRLIFLTIVLAYTPALAYSPGHWDELIKTCIDEATKPKVQTQSRVTIEVPVKVTVKPKCKSGQCKSTNRRFYGTSRKN